ncbi:MAG: sensor domain-containing diguanylate cyclase [Candidatus Omnitrophota bacterium]
MGSGDLNKLKIFIFSSLGFILVSFLVFKTHLLKDPSIFLYNFIIIISLHYLGFYRGVSFLIASIVLTIILSIAANFYYLLHIGLFLTVFFIIKAQLKKVEYHERMISTRIEETEENINLLEDQFRKHTRDAVSLDKKGDRYKHLEKVMSILSSTLVLDEVIEHIIDNALQIIGKTKNIMLFLVDTEKQELSLFSSRMENSVDKIKAKKGDVLDEWVFKQRQCLIVDDIRKDFRFSEKGINEYRRDFRSVISCPLIAGKHFLGLIRLEHIKPGNYTTEDLRLLDILCDLGAVSLQNANLYKETLDLAIRDGLTGLYLRRYFLERLHEEIARALHDDISCSLLMIDIDNFKNYNDQYGHAAGDIVLVTLSKLLKKTFEGAIVARYGGEEFSVLLPAAPKKKAKIAAEDLRKAIKKESIELRRVETHITISAGVASFPEDAKLIDELIQKADERLYMAKRQGRDKVCG